MKPSPRKTVAAKPATQASPALSKKAGLTPTQKQLIYYGSVSAIMLVSVIVLMAIYRQQSIANKPASDKARSDIKQIVADRPKLKTMYTEAMSDKVLTETEAKAIQSKALKMRKK